MDLKKLEQLLTAYKDNKLESSEAVRRISQLHYEDMATREWTIHVQLDRVFLKLSLAQAKRANRWWYS